MQLGRPSQVSWTDLNRVLARVSSLAELRRPSASWGRLAHASMIPGARVLGFARDGPARVKLAVRHGSGRHCPRRMIALTPLASRSPRDW